MYVSKLGLFKNDELFLIYNSGLFCEIHFGYADKMIFPEMNGV